MHLQQNNRNNILHSQSIEMDTSQDNRNENLNTFRYKRTMATYALVIGICSCLFIWPLSFLGLYWSYKSLREIGNDHNIQLLD